ncbi:UDP-N-acetylmuramoyl-L-alanine--D-glutamate ligase [Candidatus Sumerlaeota bacterium]|nr:UDP-N-acetylmuramoyl-L-alanine--D-glutamate ligase [Candidatus Sumerlaeota bacterium]
MRDAEKKYLVLGAARSGMAAIRLLCRLGRPSLMVDDKPASSFPNESRELVALKVPFYSGEKIPDSLWNDIQLVITSPGVPLKHALISIALERKIPVIGEMEFASRFARAPIAAITGTNGKTTTVRLAVEILCEGGIPSIPTGNVGLPLSQAILEDAVNHEKGCLVTEVSTFQLETIRDFHPRTAVLLNITPDHLDRHETMEAYRDLKYRITENQRSDDILIVNEDDSLCFDLCKKSRAQCLTFSIEKKVKRGAFLESGILYLNLGDAVPLLKSDEIPIPGMHNIQNILAAALVGASFGVKPEIMAKAVRAFKGVEHRLEFVSGINGVRFYNDSKATNLDSMEKALLSFSAPIVLITGGRDKGNNYQSLNSLIGARVKFLVSMGESAPLIMKSWGRICPSASADSMRDAVQRAFDAASSGDVILFSPGCSSFDAFQNYEHRGRAYKEEVGNFLSGRNAPHD